MVFFYLLYESSFFLNHKLFRKIIQTSISLSLNFKKKKMKKKKVTYKNLG